MIPKTLGKLGLKTAYGYIEKDPEHNLPKLMEWVDRLAGDEIGRASCRERV